MWKGSRLTDLLVLLAFIAAGSAFYSGRKAVPVLSATPVASLTPVVGGAPPFTLPKLVGGELAFQGVGPALITLSAVGCQGCQQRVATDRKAYELAHNAHVPVWNIFVYAQQASAQAFHDQYAPLADEFLYDATGDVSVRTYGGSDASCWIFIDKQGKIAYRGGSDLAALGALLR